MWRPTPSCESRELESFDLMYGSRLVVDDGQRVKIKQDLANWDLHEVILTEKSGKVRAVDFVEGVTYKQSYQKDVSRSFKEILPFFDERYQ